MLKEISVTWDISDVQEVRNDLTDEQASKVLEFVKACHDPTNGINWDVLEIAADHLFPL